VKSLPYASASTSKARDEISKTLQRFGCESVGIMDDYAKHEVILAFKHRGVAMQLHASAKGWAAWVKAQITIVECGILSFDAAFMPYMLASDGRPLIEHLAERDLLPKAQEQKVVALPAYRS
jgi:hypothetical protein